MLQATWRTVVVLAALWFLRNSAAYARPAHRRALADYFGPILSQKLNDCRTCHLPGKPEQAKDRLAEEKPHNAFGARLRTSRSAAERVLAPRAYD